MQEIYLELTINRLSADLLLCAKIAGSAIALLLFYAKIEKMVIALLFVVSIWRAFKLIALAKRMISVYIVGLQIIFFIYIPKLIRIFGIYPQNLFYSVKARVESRGMSKYVILFLSSGACCVHALQRQQ